MVQQSNHKSGPRDTLSRHIAERSSVQLPSILIDYFPPKTRLETLANRPKLEQELTRHRQRIHPILRISPYPNLGDFTHDAYPKTYLHYWLLTESQLDFLAYFYSQDTQSRWTDQYPKRMNWRADLGMEDKRIQLGRFLGFRGCEGTYPIRPRVEGFKRRVMDMVGGWKIPSMPEAPYVPKGEWAEAAAKRAEEKKVEEREMARLRKIRRLVQRICAIDEVLGSESMMLDPPPSYQEACGAMRKGWRERIREYKERKL